MLPFSENTIAHDWHSVYIASNLKGIYCINEPLLDTEYMKTIYLEVEALNKT